MIKILEEIMGNNCKNRTNGYWKNLENCKNEIEPYVEKFGGLPNSGYFKRIGRCDIMCGIYKYGGYSKLASDLNISLIQTVVQQSNCSVPIGYWQNFDNLKEALKPIVDKYGTLPPQTIIRDISFSIEAAIRYHGGFKKVRNKLKLQPLIENKHFQPYGYWGNLENVKKALIPIIEKYGTIPSSLILRAINSGLASAIERYHGGYVALRKELNLPEVKRNKDYTGISIYRTKAIKHYGASCMICGFDFDVDVHHLDNNRLNNNIDNLCVLCPNHHRIVQKKKMNLNEIQDYKNNYLNIKGEEYA